ncbi:MAG: DNA polymerase III subunit epsilon [Pseudomonadota bacterium]
MREIILDTETTGIDPNEGHRIVEIGCVEVINNVPTGRTYHQYINPERDMPAEAERVHGLSEQFLSDKPVFAEIVGAFTEFIGADQMVIHNAGFDMKHINAELTRLGMPPWPMAQATDSLAIARKRYPGAQASLDALCRRFGVDNSNRQVHGALLDAQLLAEVYLELRGGREPGLGLAGQNRTHGGPETNIEAIDRAIRPPRAHVIPEAERVAHQEVISGLKGSLWSKLHPEVFASDQPADSPG